MKSFENYYIYRYSERFIYVLVLRLYLINIVVHIYGTIAGHLYKDYGGIIQKQKYN